MRNNERLSHLPEVVQKSILNFLEGVKNENIDRIITKEYVTTLAGRFLRSTTITVRNPVQEIFRKWFDKDATFGICYDSKVNKVYPFYLLHDASHIIYNPSDFHNEMWQEMASAEHFENKTEETEFMSGRGGITFMDAFAVTHPEYAETDNTQKEDIIEHENENAVIDNKKTKNKRKWWTIIHTHLTNSKAK